MVLEGGYECCRCGGRDGDSPPDEVLELVMGPSGNKDEGHNGSAGGEGKTNVFENLCWKVGDVSHVCDCNGEERVEKGV